MATDTKPNLVNGKFEQCSGDILNLSGCTQVYGTISSNTGYKVSGTTILKTASSSVSSVLLGQGAGANNNGLCNVFIGYNAGCSSTGSNRLYIANSSACSLIYGDFTGNTVTLPTLKLCITPSVGTCNDSVLVWNSTDMTVKKLPYSSGATGGGGVCTANNGLNVIGTNVRLGGTLTGNTSITGAYTLSVCGGALLNTDKGYQVSGSTVLMTSPNSNTNILVGVNAGNSTMTGRYNSAMGYQALRCNTTGCYNSAMGYQALYCNSCGSYNSAIGNYALYANTSGSYNSAIGNYALYANTSGCYNSAIGNYALINNTTGSYNSAIGNYALFLNTTGCQNSAMGSRALYNNVTGCQNSAMGYQALYCNNTVNNLIAIGTNALYNNKCINASCQGCYNMAVGHGALSGNTYGSYNQAEGYGALSGNTTGCYNVASGYQALAKNTSGCYNSAMGNGALRNNTTGSWNSAMGNYAGFSNSIGNNNVFIGTCAGYNETGSGKLYIATGATKNLVYGDFSTNEITLPKLKLCETPATGTSTDGVLVWNSTDKCVKQITLSSGISTANNGLNVIGSNVRLGGALTGNTNITGAYTLTINGGAQLNTTCGYQVSGSTVLMLGSNSNTNILVGVNAGNSTMTGTNNSAMGYQALNSNTTGGYNSAIGSNALRCNTTGCYNLAMGYQALYSNTTGSQNSAMGSQALYFNSCGCENSAMGFYSLLLNTTGSQNTAMGSNTLINNTTGCYNLAMGYAAGYLNSTGNNNIFLGTCAGYNETGSGKLYIATGATRNLVYGDFSTNEITLSKLKLCETPAIGLSSDSLLVWNSSDKCVKTISSSSLSSSISVAQTSHGFSVGNIIRVSGVNTFAKAQADSSTNAEAVGYVTEVTNANSFKYITGGYVTTGVPVATAGTVYYLDPSTAGALTATEPVNIGQVSKPLLVVLESGAKGIFINYRGMLNSDQSPYIVFSDTIPTGIYGEGAFWFNPTTSQLYGRYGSNWIQIISNDILPIDNASYVLSDNTINNSSTGKHGLLPKLSGSQDDALRGDGTWGAVSSGSAFWTVAQGTPTRTSNTTFTLTGNYTSIYAKGLVIKWTESSVVKVAMVSIPSTYSAPNTTVTIIGDTMASIDSASLKYSLTGVEVFIARFNVVGNISANGTDVADAYYSIQPVRVLGADLQVGVAGVTNNTTIDINKNGTTMFTTKPTLISTVAYSSTPFTADSGTSLALNDKVTIDIDAVQSTPAIDLYVQLYLYPTRYLNLV